MKKFIRNTFALLVIIACMATMVDSRKEYAELTAVRIVGKYQGVLLVGDESIAIRDSQGTVIRHNSPTYFMNHVEGWQVVQVLSENNGALYRYVLMR